MKKILLVLVSLSLFTACENEPLEGDFAGVNNPNNGSGNNGGNNGGGNSGGGNNGGGVFALSSYSYDKTFTTPAGDSTIDTDFVINNSNQITSQNTSFEIFGVMVNGTAPVTRDGSGNIIETTVSEAGILLSTTTLSYSGNDIIQIMYSDVQFPDENYTYELAYSGNTVTRTEVGATDSMVYTFDANDRLIQRETLDNGTSLRIETITYDANGNLISSVITGQDATTFTYTYDTNTNPLNALFSDVYKYQLFNDNYDDQFEHWLAIWGSPNNMLSATTPDGPSNLTVTYDTDNRILTRNGSINSALLNAGSGNITTDEVFTYAN